MITGRLHKSGNTRGIGVLGLMTALLLFLPAATWAGGAGGKEQRGGGNLQTTPGPGRPSVAECGKCHPSYYRNLRDFGGAHRFPCQNCHHTIHQAGPGKKNFSDLMPKCTDCHPTPHADAAIPACHRCHPDPHAIRKPIGAAVTRPYCRLCHPGPAGSLQQFPSAHSQMECADCHSETHGRIPPCRQCHKGHFTAASEFACSDCHAAHAPKRSQFSLGIPPKLCAACHGEVFTIWERTSCSHGDVSCVVCHPRHRDKPACRLCHIPPHAPELLAKFKNCLGCHHDPHDVKANAG